MELPFFESLRPDARLAETLGKYLIWMMLKLQKFGVYSLTFSVITLVSQAEPAWTKVSSSHFVLYTTATGDLPTEFLKRLEDAESLLMRLFRPRSDVRIRVIDLAGSKEYNYNRFSGRGLYQLSWRGAYIVLPDLTPEHDQVAIHELVHASVHQAGLKIPLWMEEGLAEVYSSLHLHQGQWTFGESIGAHTLSLKTQGPLQLNVLFQIQQNSDQYTRENESEATYATSWGLVHMLVTSPAYSKKVWAFLAALETSATPADALQHVYGKSVDEVRTDLDHHLRDTRAFEGVQEAKLSNKTFAYTPLVERCSPVELILMLAALPQPGGANSEIQLELKKMARDQPGNPDLEEALGFIAIQENRRAEAILHFSAAVRSGGRDTTLLDTLVQLKCAAGAPWAETLPLLETLQQIDPGKSEREVQVGFIAAKAGQYKTAIEALSHLKEVPSIYAFVVPYVMSYSYLKLDQLGQAHKYALEAERNATSEPERRRIEAILAWCNRHLSPSQ